jgi:hypothetical protein
MNLYEKICVRTGHFYSVYQLSHDVSAIEPLPYPPILHHGRQNKTCAERKVFWIPPYAFQFGQT